MSKRAVLYLRVSTTDQTTDNQRRELERIAEEKDWEIVETIEEEQSGTEGDRPGFQRLFEMAHQQTYDVLVTWALDRFDRRGIYETLESINRLDDQGVEFYSYRESFLSDLEGREQELVMSVLSWVADMEAERRSERVKAGLERARADGKKIGRPKKLDENDREKLRTMADENDWTIQETADKAGVSYGTAHNILNSDD